MTRLPLLLALAACTPPRPPLPDAGAVSCAEVGGRLIRCIDKENGIACYRHRGDDGISCVRIEPMPLLLPNLGTEPKVHRPRTAERTGEVVAGR